MFRGLVHYQHSGTWWYVGRHGAGDIVENSTSYNGNRKWSISLCMTWTYESPKPVSQWCTSTKKATPTPIRPHPTSDILWGPFFPTTKALFNMQNNFPCKMKFSISWFPWKYKLNIYLSMSCMVVVLNVRLQKLRRTWIESFNWRFILSALMDKGKPAQDVVPLSDCNSDQISHGWKNTILLLISGTCFCCLSTLLLILILSLEKESALPGSHHWLWPETLQEPPMFSLSYWDCWDT